MSQLPFPTEKKQKKIMAKEFFRYLYSIWSYYCFKLIEIKLIAHGGNHNDTIITVEEKL